MLIAEGIKSDHLLLPIIKRPARCKIALVAAPTLKKLKDLILFSRSYLTLKKAAFQRNVVRILSAISLKCNARPQTTKELSPHEAKNFLPHCFASLTCWMQNENVVNRFGLKFFEPGKNALDLSGVPGKIEAKERCFFDEQTGLTAVILQSQDDKVFLCFGGVRSGDTIQAMDPAMRFKVLWRQRISAVKNLFGFKVGIYQQADALYQTLKQKKEFAGKKVILTGQSLGGSIASYVSAKNHVPSVCFNSIALGVRQQREIGEKNLLNAHEYVTHISAKGDFFNNYPLFNPADSVLRAIGICTPRNFGQKYQIPSAFEGLKKTHYFILGSMMHHLGYDPRAGSDALKEDDLILP